jgi:type II secretory pathway pseudopilin PulG
MPRLIFVAKSAMLDDGGEGFRLPWGLPARAGGPRDSWALAVQERAVSLLNAWTGGVTMTSAAGLEPTRGGATLAAMGRASSHVANRHRARPPVARRAAAEGGRPPPVRPRPVSGLALPSAGFTLLEVVIAVGILATILVVLFGTYTAVAARAGRARDLSRVYHEARVLLRLMADDVRAAYVNTATTPAPQTAPQASQEGLRAQVTPPTFVGEHRTDEDRPADTLAFATIVPVQRPDVPDTEMCRVAYSLEPVLNHPETLPWASPAPPPPDPAAAPSPPRGLFRRVNCHVDPTATAEDRLDLLTDAVRGLEFKYYDAQGTEYPDWNSRQPRGGAPLPARTKITLLLVDRQGQLRPFTWLTDLVFAQDAGRSTVETGGTGGGLLSGAPGPGSPGSEPLGGVGRGTTGPGGTGRGRSGGPGSGTTGPGGTGSRR